MICLKRPAQLDLFDRSMPTVPAADLFGWKGGRPPETVRRALREEIRRRSIKPAQIAARSGISRSHLVNITKGRDGAAPNVAAGLRSFILENAATVRIA